MAVLLFACSDPSEPTPGEFGQFIADGCPAADLSGIATPAAPGGSPPSTGAWRVRWRCISDCTDPVPPALARADAADISNGSIRFRMGGTTIETVSTVAVRGCWESAPTSGACRSAIRVCAAPTSTCSSSSCATIPLAGWLDATDTWQMYEATFSR